MNKTPASYASPYETTSAHSLTRTADELTNGGMSRVKILQELIYMAGQNGVADRPNSIGISLSEGLQSKLVQAIRDVANGL